MQAEPNRPGDDAASDGGVFEIKDCALIALAMGRRVTTHREFRNALVTVESESLYHHFWGGLLQARFEEREYNNDFAVWMHEDMHDQVLAERLALLDPTDHPDVDTLRQEMIDLVDERLEEAEYLNWFRAQRPFEFIRSKVVVFDTSLRLANPHELMRAVPTMTLSSIFYHFIDARRRVAEGVDDFRAWLGGLDEGYASVCAALAEVDPYFISLEELRDHLAAIFARELGSEV